MELFAIVGSVPAAFIAGFCYAVLLAYLPVPRRLRLLALSVSLAVLAWVGVEWVFLSKWGALGLRARIGPAFYLVHSLGFFLAIPALVNAVMLPRQPRSWLVWGMAAVLAGCLALPITLTQYVVSEALYGIDGYDGPYSRN
jgi:hypothetical protein